MKPRKKPTAPSPAANLPRPAKAQAEAPDYGWLYARSRSAVGAPRGPQAAAKVLGALGRPDEQFASIRVVGTNGKGSTCAMLDAGLRAAGVGPVGRFTSPHLRRFEERIVIDGRELDPQQTGAFIRWAKAAAAGGAAEHATFFDLSLGLAAQAFAGAGVRWAVMEAGVGGVSDATQALQNVRAVALTNVALDHTEFLGGTLAAIARDKAAAASGGVPLLTTAQGRALAVVQAVAAERGAPLYTPQTHPALFALPRAPHLLGAHQRSNAALAAATLRLLGLEAGLEAALQAGWAGRMELREVQGRRVLIDGAHNPAAAEALAEAVRELGGTDTLLFGNMARKDTAGVVRPLLEMAAAAVFTQPSGDAVPAAELAREYGGQAMSTPAEALAEALAATPPGGTLLVAGSLYLVGEVRALLG